MTNEVLLKSLMGDREAAQGIEIFDILKEIFMGYRDTREPETVFSTVGKYGITWLEEDNMIPLDDLDDYLWEMVEETMARDIKDKKLYVYTCKDNFEVSIETLASIDDIELEIVEKVELEVPGWELYIFFD